MAIAFDAAAAEGVSPGSSLTYSHTCTGSNLLLFVGIWQSTDGDHITAVTYNSVSMTRILRQAGAVGGGSVYLYFLINPSTGSNSVSITADTSALISAASSSYTGAKQSGQPDSSSSSNVHSTSDTETTTVVDTNCWLVMFGTDQSGGTISAGTGTTKRAGKDGGYSGGIFDSNGTVSTGSQSLQFTAVGTSDLAGVIASFSPAVASFEGEGVFQQKMQPVPALKWGDWKAEPY